MIYIDTEGGLVNAGRLAVIRQHGPYVEAYESIAQLRAEEEAEFVLLYAAPDENEALAALVYKGLRGALAAGTLLIDVDALESAARTEQATPTRGKSKRGRRE